MLIVITDGKQTTRKPYTELSVASQGVKNKGVAVYAVGVGKGADAAELKEIASSQENVYISQSFKELQSLAGIIRTRLCNCKFISLLEYLGFSQHKPGTQRMGPFNSSDMPLSFLPLVPPIPTTPTPQPTPPPSKSCSFHLNQSMSSITVFIGIFIFTPMLTVLLVQIPVCCCIFLLSLIKSSPNFRGKPSRQFCVFSSK